MRCSGRAAADARPDLYTTHPHRTLITLSRTNTGRDKGSSQPFFFNTFNAHSFAADGEWHHMVFTHCNRTLSLYVDGAFAQSCAFTTYVHPPSGAPSKERPLVALFCGGQREEIDGLGGGIRGDVGAISLTEGVWDSKTVAAQFALGPFAGLVCVSVSASGVCVYVRVSVSHVVCALCRRQCVVADLNVQVSGCASQCVIGYRHVW